MKTTVFICLAFFSSFFSGCFERGDQTLELKLHVSQGANSACVGQIEGILLERLDRFGVPSSDIKTLIEGKSLSLKVDGLFDAERTARLLSITGEIGFWETYENEEFYSYLAEANEFLAKQTQIDQPSSNSSSEKVEQEVPDLIQQMGGDTLLDQDLLAYSDEGFLLENPLFAILSPAASANGLYNGPVIGYAKARDTAQVNTYLSMERVHSAFPWDVKLIWTIKPIDPEDEDEVFQLIACKLQSGDPIPAMDYSSLDRSDVSFDGFDDQPQITMRMTKEGGRDWEILTRNNIGRSIAITLDGKAVSFPTVQSEIVGGVSAISGNFTEDEAQDLANILNSEPLPCPVKVLKKDIRIVK